MTLSFRHDSFHVHPEQKIECEFPNKYVNQYLGMDDLRVQTGTDFEGMSSPQMEDFWFAAASLASVEFASASSIKNTSSPEGPEDNRGCIGTSERIVGLSIIEPASERRRFLRLGPGGESLGDSLGIPDLTARITG
jgi:hypothetical protein